MEPDVTVMKCNSDMLSLLWVIQKEIILIGDVHYEIKVHAR
mgnify:CR=1 FL=1